jgi:hypothetical protein
MSKWIERVPIGTWRTSRARLTLTTEVRVWFGSRKRAVDTLQRFGRKLFYLMANSSVEVLGSLMSIKCVKCYTGQPHQHNDFKSDPVVQQLQEELRARDSQRLKDLQFLKETYLDFLHKLLKLPTHEIYDAIKAAINANRPSQVESITKPKPAATYYDTSP